MTEIGSFEEARAAVAAGAPPDEVARALVAAMTEQERLWCLDGDAPVWAGLAHLGADGYHMAPFPAAEVERIGLPGLRFADGPRGAVVGNATAFPVSMARGATWDPELEERIGEVIGTELRAIGANLTGAVCVNLLRHPAWGRAQETYGEDPHHVGELGAALTRGLQRHVLASVKHFACNSMENARFSVDIEVDDVALHEIFLPQFRRIIEEGAASVMSAYNSVNGEWAGQNRELLTGVLREEWGFEGFVISDWIFGMRDAARSITGGLDIEMPYRMVRAHHLLAALEAGEADWADVDRSVERIIATMLRFDGVLAAPSPSLAVLGAPEHRRLAREAAGRSIVLLRNERVGAAPVLPLAATGRIAVVGPLADRINLGDGGSSDVWDLHCTTILGGIRAAFDDVVADDGSDPVRAAQVASGAEVAVVVVGYTYLDEGEYIGATDPALGALLPAVDDPEVVARFERWIASQPPTVKPQHIDDRPTGFAIGGDRSSLRLTETDVGLIRAVAAANERTIVVIQSGSAVICSEWIDEVPAVVQAWYGGSEAGHGLADVLLGVVNPSARLPFSIPVDEADLPPFDRDATSFRYDRWHGWWRLERDGVAPAFPFGFGLSYTTFEVRSPSISMDEDNLTVTSTVANTGDLDGADVVQVFARLPDPDAPARAVGFARVVVPAADQVEVSITVPVRRLATRDPGSRSWHGARGLHEFVIGRFAGDPDAHHLEVDITSASDRDAN